MEWEGGWQGKVHWTGAAHLPLAPPHLPLTQAPGLVQLLLPPQPQENLELEC